MNPTSIDNQLEAAFFNHQPQPAFWLTPVYDDRNQVTDFEYRYCNQEFYAYTGLSPDAVLGNRVFTSPLIASTAVRQRLFNEILDVYLSESRMQAWLYNPDLGKYYSYTRNKVEGGVLTVLQDRTEEYKMMQQLESQKQLMDNILVHSSNGITVGEMIRDGNGSITDMKTIIANEAAARLTGISRDVYLTKTASALDPNFMDSAYCRQCIRCMETGEPFLMQYYLEPVGRWLEVSVSRMDENKQIYIFTDVTSVKQVQLELERSATQLQTIINRTQSGIFALAPIFSDRGEIVDFRFVMANKTLAAYVHHEPEMLVGEPSSKFFPAYLTNGLFAQFCDTYLNDKVNRFDHHYFSDGIDVWIDMMCTRFDKEVLITFTDYTPIKKLQLQLEQTVEELRRSNKSLEEFAYAASHDLKEPVRKIRVFSDRLKQQLLERGSKDELFFVDRVEHAARRMEMLVDDLLSYSHVSQGMDKGEVVDLNGKLRMVQEDLELTIQEKRATIHVGELPAVRGHRRQLQQLFQNLISNSLKYSKPDVLPVISVTSRVVQGNDVSIHLADADRSRQYHLITVEDNGIGFAQEDAERIFNVFTRLHGNAEYRGTGVGLSIVRKVVENHRGYIWADSKSGEGAIFTVLLPVE